MVDIMVEKDICDIITELKCFQDLEAEIKNRSGIGLEVSQEEDGNVYVTHSGEIVFIVPHDTQSIMTIIAIAKITSYHTGYLNGDNKRFDKFKLYQLYDNASRFYKYLEEAEFGSYEDMHIVAEVEDKTKMSVSLKDFMYDISEVIEHVIDKKD